MKKVINGEVAIRKTHPTLFKMIMGLAVTNLAIALFLVVGSPQNLINFEQFPEGGIFPPLWFYSALWIIASVMLIHGLGGNGSYKWTRKGLTLSAMVGGFWAFGFWAAYAQGDILGISAPILWSFYAYVCVTLTGEPVINPLSVAIQNDIRNHKTTAENNARSERSRKIKEQVG